jgi:hypothetical protein
MVLSTPPRLVVDDDAQVVAEPVGGGGGGGLEGQHGGVAKVLSTPAMARRGGRRRTAREGRPPRAADWRGLQPEQGCALDLI